MDFVLANCTHGVSVSAEQRSFRGRTLSNCRIRFVRGRNKRLSVVRISNFAADVSGSRTAASGRSDGSSEGKDWQVPKSSTALELLDIERGVCIPFRKYSPETVRIF